MNQDLDYLARVFFDLLHAGRTTFRETNYFKNLKHNSDLVPTFNEKFNDIIGNFERYRKISYDIQGIRDAGIDILVKYEYGDEYRRIGIQIKSYDDLKSKDWLSKLKAQIVDAQGQYDGMGLQDYYIVFCTDLSEHMDKIRNATADLVKLDNFPIHIVNPEYALFFLRISDFAISAYIKRKLSVDDPIVVDAQESLDGLSLAQSAMIIRSMMLFVEQAKTEIKLDDLTGNVFVDAVYENYPNIPGQYYDLDISEFNRNHITNISDRTRFPDPLLDIQQLSDRGYFVIEAYSEGFTLRYGEYDPLLAIMYEAKARRGYSGDEICWYTFMLLKNSEIERAFEIYKRPDNAY